MSRRHDQYQQLLATYKMRPARKFTAIRVVLLQTVRLFKRTIWFLYQPIAFLFSPSAAQSMRKYNNS